MPVLAIKLQWGNGGFHSLSATSLPLRPYFTASGEFWQWKCFLFAYEVTLYGSIASNVTVCVVCEQQQRYRAYWLDCN